MPPKKMPFRTIPDFVKHHRKRLGQSQAHAAEAMGVGRTTVLSWEKGQEPSPAHLFLISDWSGVDPDDMRQLFP